MIKYILFSLLLILIIPSFGFADENEENILKAEHIDRMVKRGGEIINGKKSKKHLI